MAFSSWIRNWKRSLERRWALYQALRRKAAARYFATRPRLEVLEDRWLLSTYVVNTTADSGTGSLRDAIDSANNTTSGITEIDFNIGTQGTSSGVQTISPATPLPALTASGVFINGFSENQWQGVSATNPYPLIELNGASAGSNSDGLDLTGANNIVSNLIIEGFTNGMVAGGANDAIGNPVSGLGNFISGNSGDGLQITASGVKVLGNYIGIDTTITNALPNGVGISVSANNVIIGGPTGIYSDALNAIAGNRGDGVYIASGVSGVAVLGNSIGNIDTAAKGNIILPNGVGVELAGSNNTIGGTDYSYNVISGNTGDGVLIDSGASGNTVLGNYIGVAFDNQAALSNNNGIEVAGNNNLLEANNISANSNDGVLLDSGSSGNQMLSNDIGNKNPFNLFLPNKVGIEDAGSGNIIGRISVPYGGNSISYNSGDGVLIDSTATVETMQNNYITNNGNGVEIQGVGNTIGGTSGANVNVRNTISGNTGDGVLIDGGASGNQVQGNFIGIATTFSGTIGMANSIGILVSSDNNTIGGSVAGVANVISGNSGDGVQIGSGASGVVVLGNYIGTDPTGTKALANGTGVEVSGSNNTIGQGGSGTALNVISGNTGDGVLLDSSSSGNQVLGNYIGTNPTGTKALANGAGIEVAGSNNTLGASYAVAPNVISGNSGDGVLLDSGSSGNQVLGSYIGTNYAGTVAVANKVGIEDAGSSNTIGGSVLGDKNVISGNSGDGVLLDGTATKETMQGNYIGTDTRGNTALANGTNGVEVQGSGNTIGGNSGANYFTRNFISGNTGDGVLIDSGASSNGVLGNFIGTNLGGTAALANSIGVEIQGTGNTLGGASSSRNLISGNAHDGVKIDSGGSGNVVEGNYIGVNTYDTAVVGNSGNGIEVAGSNNTLGASYAVAPNEISGNSNDGVLLDSGSSGNQALGNYIGTNHSGTAAVANKVGIEDAGSSNTLGGSVLGDKNVISGNTSDGVLLDSTATKETMQGNYIGLNVTAKSILANGSNGIEVQGSNNLIGGNSGSNYFTRNFLSGNTGDGVLIANGATGNVVQGNFIGLDVSGTNGAGNSIGIEVAGNSNTLGGASFGLGNVLSGNSSDGIRLDSSATNNVVQRNFVGTNYNGTSAVGNGGNGVTIVGNNNTLGGSTAAAGNTIASNSGDGVLVSVGVGNTIASNSIFANSGGGIALSNGGNNNLAAPSLLTATLTGSTLTVTGSFTAPTANVSYVLEFFANPSGDPEGKIYLGSLTVKPTSTGTQSFTFTTTTTVTGTYPLITATLTDSTGNTSAFSSGITVQ
jgi:hypothetical protein